MPTFNGNQNGNGLNGGRRLPPRPPGSGRKPNPYGFYPRRRIAPWYLQSRTNHQPKRKIALILLPLYLLVIAFVGSLLLTSGILAAPFVVGAGTYQYYYNRTQIGREYPLRFETTRIFDRNGILLFEKQPEEGLREYLQLKDVPKYIIDATLSAEDPTFFDNTGVEPSAVLRAVYINASGLGSSGASTITQQVARLLFMSPEDRRQTGFDRKINEAFLAIKLTEKFTKQEILEKYLNTIFYGNRSYGIQAASRGYFGKNAKDLTLPEASLLAGLPQLPSDYDPTVDNEHYQLAKRRQRRVLELMVQNNKISALEAQDAYAFDIKADLVDGRKRDSKMEAPHFVNYILQLMDGTINTKQFSEAGLENINPDQWNLGGYDVYTTLDLNLNNKAQEVVSKSVEDLQKLKATNAALVAMRPGTGEILSMIGSVDFNDNKIGGQFNDALAMRQPGSALKPITYATAMEKGWTAATVIADIKTSFPSGGREPYVPLNFDQKEHGPVSVRDSLGSSLNIPAVKALQYTGVQTMMDKAKQMGLNFQYPPEHYGLTLTLGGGEVRLLDLTNAYSVFDNGGKKVEPVAFLRILQHGSPVYEFDPQKVNFKQVLSPEVAYIITNILSDNKARLLAFAENNPLVLDRPAAAKTGTTNDFHDSWTMGFTPDLVAGVWVGNNDNRPMDGVAGSIGGGRVWHNFMTEVYKDPVFLKALQVGNKPLRLDFERPATVVEATICADSGLLPGPYCSKTKTELFPRDKVPTQKDSSSIRVRLSNDINGLCLAGQDYPEGSVFYRVFRVYPPELEAWAGRTSDKAPSRICQTYVPPPPTSTPAPSPSPALTVTADPSNPNPSPGGTGDQGTPPAQNTPPPAAPVQTTPPPPVQTTPPPPATTPPKANPQPTVAPKPPPKTLPPSR